MANVTEKDEVVEVDDDDDQNEKENPEPPVVENPIQDNHVLEYLENIRKWVAQNNLPEHFYDRISFLEKSVSEVKMKKKSQTRITDFFAPRQP